MDGSNGGDAMGRLTRRELGGGTGRRAVSSGPLPTAGCQRVNVRDCRSERDAAAALQDMCPGGPRSLLGAAGRRTKSLTEIIEETGAGAGTVPGCSSGGKSGNVLEQRVTVKKTIARTFRGTVYDDVDGEEAGRDPCSGMPPAPTVTAGISRGTGKASRQVKVIPVRHPDKKIMNTRPMRPEPFQQIHMMANAYDVGSYPLIVCDEWLQYLLRPSDGIDPAAASYPPPPSKAYKINLISPFSRCP